MNHALSAASLLVLWAAWVAPTSAHVPQSALAAYNDGKFIVAATVAESEGSPDALAFAARARIADAIMRDDLCFDCLVKAEATAQSAIARDPKLAEGYVQLAIAIGFRGRLVSTFDAQSEGLAEKGRAAIERPNSTAEFAGRASSAAGIENRPSCRQHPRLRRLRRQRRTALRFRAALRSGSLLLHITMRSRSGSRRRSTRQKALETLQTGCKDPRTDALLAFTRERTDKLMKTLKAGSSDDIEALVRRYQGYPVATAEDGAR
jgi:hypothetical protein